MKSDLEWGEAGVPAKKVMSLTEHFSVPIFSATQILLLSISRDSDNIRMSYNKITSKRLSVPLILPLYYHIMTIITPLLPLP